jgi:hypothetical protein
MTNFEKQEIVRDNRVARLLWFSIGFLCAFGIMSLLKG